MAWSSELRDEGRILLDCSAARLDVPVIDVYKLPDFYAAHGISR